MRHRNLLRAHAHSTGTRHSDPALHSPNLQQSRPDNLDADCASHCVTPNSSRTRSGVRQETTR